MPLDGTQKKLPKTLSMTKKMPEVLSEEFIDPENYLFSKNTELGEVHDFLMNIWPEEGLTPADVLEMGKRISEREDCKYSMLEVCNALADLAQHGKIRVKQTVMTNGRFNHYGLWAD